MAEVPIIYMHILSRFSCFAISVVSHLGINYEERTINISTGQNREEWFLKINPKGTIPAIQEKDHCQGESVEICKYLIKSREISTPLYPLDNIEKCKEIDKILEIQSEIELKGRDYLKKCYIGPLFFGYIYPTAEKVASLKKPLMGMYQRLDEKLAKKETKYFVDDYNPTLADFYLFTMIYTVNDKGLADLEEFPMLKTWFERMENIEALDNIRNRARRFMKFAYIYGAYIAPIIRCLKCKRRRNPD
mmetsp:Transcript_27479/g.24357  ORF Transcript_27479/g.24357 Transcript_27479/m.24357 type:complete len:247 (+) Transcript_27479:23-763(+)